MNVVYPCDSNIHGLFYMPHIFRPLSDSARTYRDEFTEILIEKNFDLNKALIWLREIRFGSFRGAKKIHELVYKLPYLQEILLLLWEFRDYVETVDMRETCIFVQFR